MKGEIDIHMITVEHIPSSVVVRVGTQEEHRRLNSALNGLDLNTVKRTHH